LEKTVSVINLELLGRTDGAEGTGRGRASLTGFAYSDLGEVFRLAGKHFGIAVSGHDSDSGTYFSGSDNFVFAEKGVPAHTLCVSYLYPDYHGAADHWEKIDFDNMEKTVRMTVLAVLTLAQSERVPRWNPSDPRAERFLKARRNAERDDR
jgi:Zn-dependent M28 family amino/carboxypeptidase